jgi:hypothetical protein
VDGQEGLALVEGEVDLVPDVLGPDGVGGDEHDEERAAGEGSRDLLRPFVARVDPLIVPNAIALSMEAGYLGEDNTRVSVRIAHEGIRQRAGVCLEGRR